MYIWDSIVDEIIANITIEYAGCHAPHKDTPLYGRAAYWRLYNKDGSYISKVTTPVKVMNPSKKTLAKLLKTELIKRIGAIKEVCEQDDYGTVVIYNTDPYSIRRLLDVVKDKRIRHHSV